MSAQTSDPAGHALSGLAAELRSRGVDATEDGDRGLVLVPGAAAGHSSALLRPHRGGLWWWIRRPVQDGVPPAPSGVPLAPAHRTSHVAGRIARAPEGVPDGAV
ncbi:hypothetical protein [Nocardiopsis salina]|uniref:hypothetical protein n=1 Tax=Nocardiopsis salina TaxID=245836 RepID=UPI00034D3893|nr:hypothetical protein [Nocardiopsis salina]